MRLAGPRAKLRSVQRRSLESADYGVECRAGGVPGAAMRRLLEFLVKLQGARYPTGSVAGLSNVAAGLFIFTPSCLDGE
jgi:hypothetical protein